MNANSQTWAVNPCLAKLLLLQTIAELFWLSPLGFPQTRLAFAEEKAKQVLVLYSTRRDAELTVMGDREMPGLISAGLKRPIDYYSEYFDLPRASDAMYQKSFRDFLDVKYRNQRFDLIIAVQDVAVDFLSHYRDDLFPSTPVIYLAQDAAVPRLRNSTGFVSQPDLAGTVSLIKELQPDTRQVFVITGASVRDNYYERLCRQHLTVFGPEITFTYLSGLPTDQLEQRLATLPEHSVVYYVLMYRDGIGQNFNPIDYLDRVTSVANRPTYSWTESAMNHGIVGGNLRSQRLQIDAVAGLALRILRGDVAESIPVAELKLGVDQIDWRQLRRWNINEALVPPGIRVLFRDPSIWDLYKPYIIITALILVLQSAFVVALLVQRAKRRRAEKEVTKRQAELLASYDQVRDLGMRLLNARETERSRIASDLHDDVTQALSLLTLDLKVLSASGEPLQDVPRLIAKVEDITNTVRNLSHELHPSQLRTLGLVSSLKRLQHQYSASGIAVAFSHSNVPPDISDVLALSLYRIVQEGVQNAIKHSAVKDIIVQLQGSHEKLTLSIVDRGVGFQIDGALRMGLGLISIRERAESLGGTFKITSAPGHGTRLDIDVPFVAQTQATTDDY